MAKDAPVINTVNNSTSMSSSTGVILLTYVSPPEIVTPVDQTAQQKLSFLHAVMLPCLKDLQSVQGHIISSKHERAEHTHTLRRHAGRDMSETDLLIMYGLRKDHSPL